MRLIATRARSSGAARVHPRLSESLGDHAKSGPDVPTWWAPPPGRHEPIAADLLAASVHRGVARRSSEQGSPIRGGTAEATRGRRDEQIIAAPASARAACRVRGTENTSSRLIIEWSSNNGDRAPPVTIT